jgi:hypothetical protein
MGSFGALSPLMFIVLATGLAFRFSEALDSATVLHLLRASALFHPMRPHTMHVHEELEKKKIRDIHRETSDKPLPHNREAEKAPDRERNPAIQAGNDRCQRATNPLPSS